MSFFLSSKLNVLFLLIAALGFLSSTALSQAESAAVVLARAVIAEQTDAGRDSKLSSAAHLVDAKLSAALREEGNRVLGKGPQNEVLRIYLLSLRIAEQIGDKAEIAASLNSVGNAQSNADEKVKAYERGLAVSREIPDEALSARLLYNLSRVYFGRDPDKARSLANESAGLSERTGNKLLLASALGLIGNTHAMQGDAVTALAFGKRALALREQVGDKDAISISLSNLGIAYLFLDDHEKALEMMHRTVTIMEEIGLHKETAIDLYNIGNAYLSMGDYANAMHYYQKSAAVRRENGEETGADLAMNIGSVYLEQGEYEQARSYFATALKAFENVTEGYGLSTALGSMGDVHLRLGSYKEAIGLLNRAVEVDGRLKRTTAVAKHLERLGDAYAKLGDVRNALSSYDRALEQLAVDNRSLRANILFARSRTQLEHKDLAGAMQTAQKGIDLAGDAPGLSHEIAGRVALANGDRRAASGYFERSIAEIERRRTRTVGGAESSSRFFSLMLRPYHGMIEIMLAKDDHAALEYAERARSRSLLDGLASVKRGVTRSMSPAEVERERELRRALASLNKQQRSAADRDKPDQVRVASLRTATDKARLELEDFQTRIYALYPELRIQRGELSPFKLSDAVRLIGGAGVIAEFVVAENKLFIFSIAIGKAGAPVLKTRAIELRNQDIAGRIEEFRGRLSGGDLDFQKLSRELYDMLLKPLEAELAGKTNIIIVPDGPLWDLPFQALQDGTGRYLVERASISYAPSLTALREMSKKAKARPRSGSLELLAFGNPIVGKETSERVKRVFMSEKLDPLPESERLVNELGKMYGANRSKIFVGDHAREETAKTESPKYRIVQFATHGILNNVSPMYSHLVLAQNDKNPNEDGLLEAWEMKDLDLKADMVILSACETARGRIAGGEGVIGMSWAMFIAGAPTTVASQWKVESSSTTELMLEFHRGLLAGKGISKAEALRRASLKLMKIPKYKHPSYWAGFVIVGDGS